MVAPTDTTLAYIRKKVRRLTASPSESTLKTSDLDTYINNFYQNDFPYAIKLDQTRSVYTFYTQPNIDKYPLDVNFNQGIREPVYFEGIRGSFFKDRDSFYAMWPRWPTRSTPATGDGLTTQYSFTVGAVPFLRNEVTIGSVDINGNAISIADDGYGNLQLQYTVPQNFENTSVPSAFVGGQTYPPQYPNQSPPYAPGKYPGMYNQNSLNPALNNNSKNPGLINPNVVTNDPLGNPYNGVGRVNYITGLVEITFPVAPAASEQIIVWVSQYQNGRPYSLLFWNNYFIVRPIPKYIHKVEVETYLTPVQFMNTTDNPILNQWSKYLSYGVAIDILNDRQDMEGVENLLPIFKEQEGLCLERQGVEEIGQRNKTVFTQTQQIIGWNNGSMGWYGF